MVQGKQYTKYITILDDHVLIKDGPYELIRHPGYAADLICVIVFICVIGGNGVAIGVCFLTFFFTLVMRITREEYELKLKFGKSYNDYAKKTSFKLLPMVV